MSERVRRVSRQALVIALVTLATNGVQWQTARVNAETQRRASEQRDELLDAAFQRSTRALEDARAVLEEALKTCAKRAPGSPQVMYQMAEPEPVPEAQLEQPKIGTSTFTPTQRLDMIALRERYSRKASGLDDVPREAKK